MTHAPPTFLSLFAEIGGFDLALERAGFRCASQIEIDPFCTRVLAARFPSVPRWGDVRTFGGDPTRSQQNQPDAEKPLREGLERPDKSERSIDLIVGGFPCQDFSVAGKRAGLAGYRGTLFWEIIRIAKQVKPTWGLFENVPGLLSSRHGRDFWAVLQGLRECWPAVGWRVLDSRHFGVPQRRRRIYLVCGPSEAAVASVLFESEGGGGHPPAGGEEGTRIASSLTRGSHGPGVNAPERRKEDDENLVVTESGRGYWSAGMRPLTERDWHDGGPIAATLNCGGNDGGFRTEPGEHLVVDLLTQTPYADKEEQHQKLVTYFDGGQLADTLDTSGASQRMPDKRRFQAVVEVADQGGSGLAVVRRLTPL